MSPTHRKHFRANSGLRVDNLCSVSLSGSTVSECELPGITWAAHVEPSPAGKKVALRVENDNVSSFTNVVGVTSVLHRSCYTGVQMRVFRLACTCRSPVRKDGPVVLSQAERVGVLSILRLAFIFQGIRMLNGFPQETSF